MPYRYTGSDARKYPDYLDESAGRMLTAAPGGTYSIRVAPGRAEGLPVPPGDGRWAPAPESADVQQEAAGVVAGPEAAPDPGTSPQAGEDPGAETLAEAVSVLPSLPAGSTPVNPPPDQQGPAPDIPDGGDAAPSTEE